MTLHSFEQGFSGKGLLLYLHDEKNLFVKQSARNSTEFFQCYHILQKNQPDYKPCPVYCTVAGGECHRNAAIHSHSTNHKVEYRDMLSLNAMKETCRWLKDHCPSSANKIPLQDIFLLEISK